MTPGRRRAFIGAYLAFGVAILPGAYMLSAAPATFPATVNPPHVLPQPSIEERDTDDELRDCVIYQTRVMQPPLIDWHCAEETADMDGGSDLAKNFASALLAVRDHHYEEVNK